MSCPHEEYCTRLGQCGTNLSDGRPTVLFSGTCLENGSCDDRVVYDKYDAVFRVADAAA